MPLQLSLGVRRQLHHEEGMALESSSSPSPGEPRPPWYVLPADSAAFLASMGLAALAFRAALAMPAAEPVAHRWPFVFFAAVAGPAYWWGRRLPRRLLVA